MEKENSPSESNTNNDNNNVNLAEQQMLKVFKMEREDIIKQKVKNEFSMHNVQTMIQVQVEEMKKIMEWTAELELENTQLKEAAENEIETKLRIGNDVENIKKVTEMFYEQMNQLKHTLQTIESNTDNIRVSKDQLFQNIANHLKERTFKKKFYLKEVNKIETFRNDHDNDIIQVIKEKNIIIEQQHEKLISLRNNEQQLKIALTEKQNTKSEHEIEVEKIKTNKDESRIKFTEINQVFAECVDKYNFDKMNNEIKIKNIKTNITADQEDIVKIKSKIDNSKQEHNNINTEISKVQDDLKQLELEQCEKQDLFTLLQTKLNDLKTKMSNKRNEKNSEVNLLQEKLKNATETRQKLKERNKELEQQLEERSQTIEHLKQEKLTKSDEKDEIIKQIEDLVQREQTNLVEHEKETKNYTNKITEVQQRNQHKNETNDEYKKNIEDKLKEISEIKTKIETTKNENIAIFEIKNSTFKSLKEELKSAKTENQTMTSELQNVSNSTGKEIKLIEKNNEDKINKVKKEKKQFREKMNTMMKNDQDKYIKEKRCLTDSIKTSELLINELKSSKETLQQEIAVKIKQILDVTNKIEIKNNEIQVKKADNLKNTKAQAFQFPTLPTKKPVRKTKTGFTTSTPKTILKKPVENIETKINPKESEKQVILSPIGLDSETPEDDNYGLNKNISSTQKPQKSETRAFEFTALPTKNKSNLTADKNKRISLTQATEPKRNEFLSSQAKSWKNVSLWPTDNETSDDGFKNKNIIPSTQKSEVEKIKPTDEKKRSVYDFMASDSEINDFYTFKSQNITSNKKAKTDPLFGDSENNSSDDGFFGKLDKSKKIQSEFKKSTQPIATINLNTSTSD